MATALPMSGAVMPGKETATKPVPSSASEAGAPSATRAISGDSATGFSRDRVYKPAAPPQRQWYQIRGSQSGDDNRLIRVVTFNMSTELRMKRAFSKYLELSKYGKLKSTVSYYHSRWRHRKNLFQQEVLDKRADVICLQEVDKYDDIAEMLSPFYDGVYERKPILKSQAYYTEGLAIFWKRDKFELVGRAHFHLGDPHKAAHNIAMCARLRKIGFEKKDDDEVDADVSKDEAKEDKAKDGESKIEADPTIDVWNAHFYDGRFEYVRLNQAQTLMGIIGSTSETELSLGDEESESCEIVDEVDKSGLVVRRVLRKRGVETPEKLEDDVSGEDLAEKFKAIMLSRISSDESAKSEDAEDEKDKGADADEDAEAGDKAEKEVAGGGRPRERTERYYPKTGRGYYETTHNPQLLKRPVVLCVDTGGDCYPTRPRFHEGHVVEQIPVPITSYAYLTWRSRSTKDLPRQTGADLSQVLPPKDQLVHSNWHGFFLQSAYALGFGHEPEFTNYYLSRSSNPYARTKNFILFTPQNFRVINLLDVHSRSWINEQETQSLPCANYPSDHILIGCDFEIATFKAIPAIEKHKDDVVKRTEATAQRYRGSHGPATSMRPVMHGYPMMPPPMGRGGGAPFPMPPAGVPHGVAPGHGPPPGAMHMGRGMMPGRMPMPMPMPMHVPMGMAPPAGYPHGAMGAHGAGMPAVARPPGGVPMGMPPQRR
jgi:mRNA deadenylase 3'-5' endonuclease subunit Ccr4